MMRFGVQRNGGHEEREKPGQQPGFQPREWIVMKGMKVEREISVTARGGRWCIVLVVWS